MAVNLGKMTAQATLDAKQFAGGLESMGTNAKKAQSRLTAVFQSIQSSARSLNFKANFEMFNRLAAIGENALNRVIEAGKAANASDNVRRLSQDAQRLKDEWEGIKLAVSSAIVEMLRWIALSRPSAPDEPEAEGFGAAIGHSALEAMGGVGSLYSPPRPLFVPNLPAPPPGGGLPANATQEQVLAVAQHLRLQANNRAALEGGSPRNLARLVTGQVTPEPNILPNGVIADSARAHEQLIATIIRETATMGMTREELERFNVQMSGAGRQQLETLEAAQRLRRERELQIEIDRKAAETARRLAELTEQARTPLERFSAEMRRLRGSGISQQTFGRLAMRQLDQLAPRLGDAPLLGAMRAGDSDTASILQNSATPRAGRAAEILATLQALETRAAEDAEVFTDMQGILAAIDQRLAAIAGS